MKRRRLLPVVLLVHLFALSSTWLQAQCDEADRVLLCQEGDMVNDVVFDCGFSCFLSSDITACFAQCIGDGLPQMSQGCVSCFADQSTCVTNNCFFACAFGSEADCEACVAENCQSSFESCAGIVDLDLDGESNVCDCNDSDATVYPGAAGTGQGVDNNCDGVLAADEALCPLDLNGDLSVTVADVLSLLSEFGCTSGCANDVSGDDQVTVSDLLVLLGGYGASC